LKQRFKQRKLLAGDIVEIGSALVEIRDKSIRFQHEMRKRRRLSHELARDRARAASTTPEDG